MILFEKIRRDLFESKRSGYFLSGFLYAFLLYFPTLYGVSEVFFLFLIPLVFFIEYPRISQDFYVFRSSGLTLKAKINLLLIGVIFFVSLLNKIFNGPPVVCLSDYYASFMLFPFCVFVSFYMRHKELYKFVLVFICIETCFSVVEYYSGVRSVFVSSAINAAKIDTSFLYNLRTYGLSSNSSVFAYKILVGVLFVELLQIKWWWSAVIRLFLIVALVLTFNRTVIIVVLFFWSLCFLQDGIQLLRKKKFYLNYNVGLRNLQHGIVFLFLLLFWSQYTSQLSRGGQSLDSLETATASYEAYKKAKEKRELDLMSGEDSLLNQDTFVMSCAENKAFELMYPKDVKNNKIASLITSSVKMETSGRKLIWFNYLSFISENVWFGNGSDKLYLRSWQPKKQLHSLIHSHNSYLHLLATNGIIISLLYFFFYASFVNRYNWIPVFTILLYSVGQYGVFWGMSFVDISFFILLFQISKDKRIGT